MELQYIWASSYLELREYNKAYDQFKKIDGNALLSSAEYQDIFPFYIRRYLKSIQNHEDADTIANLDGDQLISMVRQVPQDSPIRSYLDQELFSALWGNQNYLAMLRLNNRNLSQRGKAWIALANQALNQAYKVSDIIDAQSYFANNLAYSNILKTLDPANFRAKGDLTNLVEMSLRLPEYRGKALDFAKRYTELTKNLEYQAWVNSRVMALSGQRKDAALYLYQYIKDSPRVSTHFYTNTHAQLVRHQLDDKADEIALLANKIHRQNFFFHSKGGIEFHSNPDYILEWYKTYYKNLSPEQHLEVLRGLIRTDIVKAEEATDLSISYNMKNPQFILIQGLIKEHLGKEEEAYKNYLRLIFQDPFGYAGIVAKEKEKNLRVYYRDIFEKATQNIMEEFPKFYVQDKLMLYKSFLLDEELAEFIDEEDLAQAQKDFNDIVYKDIKLVPKIPILEKYPASLSNLALETQDYIENAIIEQMKNNKNFHDYARYYYKYSDILTNSDIGGYLTFRLYFYIRDKHGYTYLPNYPKEIVDLTFPKPEFEQIKEWSGGDEDLAYWMLSSFMAESHFRKRVYSQVGAVGFAQVMPYTATDIKRWMKRPDLSNYDFYDNLRMGIYYHKKMYEDFDNDIILSLAAYNAGPTATNRWLKKYGHIQDKYLFIEAINYKETRNYVKIIIYNHGMYRILNDFDLY